MGEDSFKNFIVGFILISLFATMIIMAVNYQGSLYDKDTSQITGGALDVELYNDSISSVGSTGETLRQTFEKQSIFAIVGDVVISGLFDLGISMVSMIITPYKLISTILFSIFHVPPVVTNTILGLLSISLIFAVWRLIKVGD